jgi:hypothetical protein
VATQRSLRLEGRPALAGHPPQAARRGQLGSKGAALTLPSGLLALFIDPPGSMQRGARGVGTGVQILKLFPKFSMANFKNRLTTTKAASLRRTEATSAPADGLQKVTPRLRPAFRLPRGCLQRSLRLERRPAVAGRPSQAGLPSS